MESSEFVDALPQQAYDPLSLQNPWIWVTAILIGLLVLWLGWHFGSTRAREDDEDDLRKVVDRIYDRINDKARIAAAAPRGKVVSAAWDLHDEIRSLLGPVVDLTPFGRRANALGLALAGKSTSRDHGDPEPGGDSHGDAHSGGHGDGHGSHGGGHDGGGAHPATANSPAGPQVNISITSAAPHGDKPHGDKGHGDAHGGRDAVRDAVIDICDYWSRSTMKAELAAAQKALTTMPASKPKASGGGGHH